MTLHSFERLREIILKAADLGEPERTAYVDSACGDDSDLREECARLLHADPGAVSELESRLVSLAGRLPEDPEIRIPAIGESLGPYRLDRLLGTGGSGTVFEAFQEAPVQRRVAIKLLHRNRPASADLARFRAEQQILANLDHPNIAKVHDAGTTADGVAYFVLELVEGEPITRYARSASLSRDERLHLCLQACRAAEHAHAKGIIHRDLKPSNILVSRAAEGPVVKIIDFGIARSRDLEAGASLTMEGLYLGTPEYMSPEQAGGGSTDCDVKTDVHALGNLVQEVLCGKGVYDVGSLSTSNQLRVVAAGRRELLARDNAGRPLPTDLRRIIAAATEPDRDLRYPTAAALAEDIDRFRTHRPVMVQGAGFWYQLRKAAERRPVAAALLCVLVVVVFGSLAALLSLNALEREATQRAQAEAARAENLINYLTGVLQAAAPDRMGREVTLVDAFEDATRKAEVDLHGDPATLSHFLYIIAQVECQIGNYDMALDVLARSDSARVRDAKATEQDRLHRTLARATVQRNLGNFAASDSLLYYVLAVTHGKEDLSRIEALTLIDLGDTHQTRGEMAKAESTGAAAMAILGASPVGSRGESYYDAVRIRCRGLGELGARAEAREMLRREAAACEMEFGPDHGATAGILMDFAQFLTQEDIAEKLVIMERLLETTARKLGPDHLRVAATENNLAVELMTSGRASEAAPYMADAQRIWQAHYGRVHPYLGTAENNLGYICHVTGDMAGAELHYREALAIYGNLDPQGFVLAQCNARKNLAEILLRQGRFQEAEVEVRRGLEAIREEHSRSETAAWTDYTLGAIRFAEGRIDEAMEAWRAAELALHAQDDAWPMLSAMTANGFGCALMEVDPERARQLLAEAESELFKKLRTQDSRVDALQRTAAVLRAHGESEWAAKYDEQIAYLVAPPEE